MNEVPYEVQQKCIRELLASLRMMDMLPGFELLKDQVQEAELLLLDNSK
jgi:hypothetical protein